MRIDGGKLSIAKQLVSPNCNARPESEISLIVIHCISLPAGNYATSCVEELFCNQLQLSKHPDFASLQGLKVSSHLFIRRDGSVLQFVPFHLRAWHAGKSMFRGRPECNDFSVGIELEGTDQNEFCEAQYRVLISICQLMKKQWALSNKEIVGHSDIAPGRKTDPGSGFDWPRLHEALADDSALVEHKEGYL